MLHFPITKDLASQGKRPAAREYNSLERETEWYLAQIPKERGKRTDLSPQGDKCAMIAHYCGFRKGVPMTPFPPAMLHFRRRGDKEMTDDDYPMYTALGRSLFTSALAGTVNDLDRLPPDSAHTASWFLDRLEKNLDAGLLSLTPAQQSDAQSARFLYRQLRVVWETARPYLDTSRPPC